MGFRRGGARFQAYRHGREKRTMDTPQNGVPVGMQRLLRLARVEEAFLDLLILTRAKAAELAMVQLSKSEVAVLEAATEEQLREMVRALPPIDDEAEATVRAHAEAVLSAAEGGDVDEPAQWSEKWTEGASNVREPAVVTLGITPDFPNLPGSPVRGHTGQVKGIRPGIPVAAAALGAVLVGGVAAKSCTDGREESESCSESEPDPEQEGG